MSQGDLLNVIKAAYVDGRIDLGEFEEDVGLALAGRTPGTWKSQHSTEEPAGPVTWFEPKYFTGYETW